MRIYVLHHTSASRREKASPPRIDKILPGLRRETYMYRTRHFSAPRARQPSRRRMNRSHHMVRAGVPEGVAMKISGHKTRSAFERYNLIDGDNLRDGIERTETYLQEREQRAKPTRVVRRKGKRR